MSALDAGAAEGDISFWLADRFRHVTAIELMSQTFATLAERARSYPDVKAIKADIASFPIDQPFDCIFLLGVLHYFPDDDVKRSLLVKCIGGANYAVFARTGIREFRVRDGFVTNDLARYTPISVLRDCADAADVDFSIIDNSYRGRGEFRLGDLIVFRSRHSNNPIPDAETLILSAPNTLSAS